MTFDIRRHRNFAFCLQGGTCYYCGCSMWLTNPAPFMAAFGLNQAQAYRLQCTGEHLLPASEGGRATADNIVAACRFCNETRHRQTKPPTPEVFRAYIRNEMARGCWQRAWIFNRGLARSQVSKAHSNVEDPRISVASRKRAAKLPHARPPTTGDATR